MGKPSVVQRGTWSFLGGRIRPAFVVVVSGRVWGSYCYESQALSVAARLTGRENVDNMPELELHTPWEA